MIMEHNKWLKKLVIIIILCAIAFIGLKLFNEFAKDDMGDYDGGRGEYVDEIENG